MRSSCGSSRASADAVNTHSQFDLASPALTGRRCYLSSVAETDLWQLYHVTVLSEAAATWRYSGTIPSFQQFAGEFWSGVHTQLAIRDSSSRSVCGLVVSYAYDAVNGHTKAGVVVEPVGRGLGLEAMFLFLDHLFQSWPVRRIYFEVPDFNIGRLGSVLDEFASMEGRLRGHLYWRGEWHDQLIFVVDRASGAASRIHDVASSLRT